MSNQDETPEKAEAVSPFEFGQSTRRAFLSRLGGYGQLVGNHRPCCYNVGAAF
jgi:hypothetical protein